MATLLDHQRHTKTRGTVESLTGFMVSAQVIAYPARPVARLRACQGVVRAAIRRGGRTDAGQELIMSDTERAAWDAANPIPEG